MPLLMKQIGMYLTYETELYHFPALPPSHNVPLPTPHEGPEIVHPDTVLGSGEGPGIDKGGGIHDLSHHGDHEPGHVETDRPRHTGVLRPSTVIPSGCYSLFLSHGVRKLVFVVSDQVRRKPACAAT